MDDFDTNAKQNKGGKKGKKDRKKRDEDDEDLEAELERMKLEIEGKAPPPKPEETVKATTNGKENKPKAEPKPESKPEPKPQQKQQPKQQPKQQQQQKQQPKAEPQPGPSTSKDDDAKDSGDDESSADAMKNKKKTKKEKEAEKKAREEEKKAKENAKKKAKGPGAKALALMKELLAKEQEEKERFEREEQERIEREEAAEAARLEQLRLEQEKKDKKKLKEKERKERLKKEGKLLTAKQKADIARAQASLAAAVEQGVVVQAPKDPNAAPKMSERQRRKEAALAKQRSEEERQEAAQAQVQASVVDDVVEDVVDDWEAMCSDDDDSSSAATSSKKKDAATPAAAAALPSPKVTVEPPKFASFEPAANSSAAACSKPPEGFRSPIICVLGHVDTGKTKCLDYIRKTHVQDNEAGGITQQIGATFVPPIAIQEQCKFVSNKEELRMPGLLIIDTPGHESFTNLRSRGSSLCDIAILVIDIMHGLENQTIESINLLRSRKTPFVVALNKIDRLYGWKPNFRKDVQELVNSQGQQTKDEFTKRTQDVIVQLAEQSINAALFYKNPDPKSFVSLVPTSAHSGDGMGNLINHVIQFTQNRLGKRITYVENQLDCTVLEVKAIHGLGTTVDVILVNGKLREGDKIVLAGHDGPIVTQIRSLLVPQPLKELRVKSPYEELKVVYGSMGIKIAAHDLEKAVAGLNCYVASSPAEEERLKELCWTNFSDAMKSIKCKDKGVYVQASTLGSLEALLEFLKESKIPYAGVRIGPVVKKDVMKASIMLENSPDHAVILAFDVKVERDAQELADSTGVKIFQAEIIYHLFDRFTEYKAKLKAERKEAHRHMAVFPCALRILPNCIFNKRDPIVIGVAVEDGILVSGTPIAVPGKDLDMIGRVSTIEHDHKQLESAKKGQEVCIKIDHCSSDAPKLYGRHFDHTDTLYSKVSRESIDIMKEHFRDDLDKSDWVLMVKLKKLYGIL